MARELEENVEQKPYFEAVQTPSPETDEGTREMGELYPFLISGGSNTERFYFTHINDTTAYKFNNFLYKSLFNESRLYRRVVEVLSKQMKGLPTPYSSNQAEVGHKWYPN